MPRSFAQRWLVVIVVCVSTGFAIAVATHRHAGLPALIISADHETLLADGYAETHLIARASDGSSPRDVTWRLETGRNLAELQTSASNARLRPGIVPGTVALVAMAQGLRPARINLTLLLDPTDQFGDGTPDFLRLQDEEDRIAFRRWFAFLAESTYFEKETDRPQEVNDCAALIRFAYREALHRHDGPWANQWHLSSLPDATSIRKYDYPHTVLGAQLFRTRPGAFTPDDIAAGTFAEFADAESLRRFNTHFVSRDLTAARPGDLLFFRQAASRMPFHTMVYLGGSFFGEGTDWLIYHTGPSEKHKGEIRRVTVRDLLQHPQVNWRPLPQNPAFLGVYRWNILREGD